MRAYLSFDLEKPEDRDSFKCAQQASQYQWCIDEIFTRLRSISKYEGKEIISIEEVREIIRDCMEQYEL
jgi:hypothetical protein